jgi:hypothetical protein
MVALVGNTYGWQLWDHLRMAVVGQHADGSCGIKYHGSFVEPHEITIFGTTCNGSSGTEMQCHL